MALPGPITRAHLLLGAAISFLAVFGITFAVDDPRQAVTVLYVVPIALVALAAGVRAGVVAGVIATLLVAIWVVAADVEIGMSGWISRLVAFFIIAVLVGRYAELTRDVARRRAEEQAAAEVQEGVVQSLVIATYELRRGNVPAGEHAVEDALAAAKEIISSRLPDVRPGDLRRPRPDGETPGS